MLLGISPELILDPRAFPGPCQVPGLQEATAAYYVQVQKLANTMYRLLRGGCFFFHGVSDMSECVCVCVFLLRVPFEGVPKSRPTQMSLVSIPPFDSFLLRVPFLVDKGKPIGEPPFGIWGGVPYNQTHLNEPRNCPRPLPKRTRQRDMELSGMKNAAPQKNGWSGYGQEHGMCKLVLTQDR